MRNEDFDDDFDADELGLRGMDEAPDIPRYSGSKRSNRDEFLVDRTGEPPRKRARRDIIDDDDI